MQYCARSEPTLDEIMIDPTVTALMSADRVNPDRLRVKLQRLRLRIAAPADGLRDDDLDPSDEAADEAAARRPCC